MKTIVKLVLGTAVLAAGISAANAAVPLPSTGSSDLLFFVADTSSSTSYTQVLSQTIGTAAGSVFNSADATSNASGAVQDVSVATINGKSNFSYNATTNTNLESFISGAETAGDSLVWGVYAGATNGSVLTNRKVLGGTLGMSTAADPSSVVSSASATFVSGAVSTGLNGDIKLLNTKLDSFGGASNTVASSGVGNPAADFYSQGVNAGIEIGSAAHLYGMTGNGGAGGQVLGYDLGTITFDGSTLSFTGNSAGTSPVPLPAAAWLFGSGLLGLLGIGRRRNVAPAV